MCIFIYTRIHRHHSRVARKSVADSISPRDTDPASGMPPKRASGKYPKGKRTRANGYDRPSGWSSNTAAEIAAEAAAQALADAEVADAEVPVMKESRPPGMHVHQPGLVSKLQNQYQHNCTYASVRRANVFVKTKTYGASER